MKKYFILLSICISSCSVEKEYLFNIKTPYGDMKAVLFDKTPQHKQNFLRLTHEGLYDSSNFHRVIENFMIQGGEINMGVHPGKEIDYTIPAEFNKEFFHQKGAIAAARTGDQVNPLKASSGSQFYIVQGRKYSEQELDNMATSQTMYQIWNLFGQLIQKEEYKELREEALSLEQQGNKQALKDKVMLSKPLIEKEFGAISEVSFTSEQKKAYSTLGGAPHLDGAYTVFGKIIDGLDVIDSIASQPKGGADKPVKDIFMKIEVSEVSKKKISKKYNFVFPVAEAKKK